MTAHPDVLILGGGVIGLTTAYLLARDGIQVEVLDQSDFGREASWAGAGILPPGNLARARTPYDQLRAQSATLHATLAAELRERTGIDNGYLRCGGIEFLERGDEYIETAWRDEGIRFEKLDERSIGKLEPELSPQAGYYLPDLAQVRNPRHIKALIAACQSAGVRLRPGCPIVRFESNGSRVTAAETSAGSLAAKQFLLATGAWTAALLSPFDLHPQIRPVRGQITLLNTGAPRLRHVVSAGLRYLVPRADGRVLVGSTEEDAGFEKRTTAEAIRGLLGFAVELVPVLSKAHLEQTWAGLRPGSADGLPYLGPVPEVENLFVAAGHFRAGIQLSPATAQVMKELLQGRQPAISLEPFRLDRAPAERQRVAFRS
jgi:glycine oxidase